MKIKLKKGEKLSSNNNFCNLEYDDWISLNQGRTIEMDTIPDNIKDKTESPKKKKGSK